jgi:hypothetical protein
MPAARELRRDLVQLVHRPAHVVQAAGGCAARRAALLEQRALLVANADARPAASSAGDAAAPQRESGKNRSFSDTPRLPLQLREVAVHREQAQRHVGLAARQVADEVLQREHRAVDDAHRRALGRASPKPAKLPSIASQNASRPIRAHHAQRSAHLVQVLGQGRARPRLRRAVNWRWSRAPAATPARPRR